MSTLMFAVEGKFEINVIQGHCGIIRFNRLYQSNKLDQLLYKYNLRSFLLSSQQLFLQAF